MMATAHNNLVSVLAGPTCPSCASDDLRFGPELGAQLRLDCQDCQTEYHWYRCDLPEPVDHTINGSQSWHLCPACRCTVDAEGFCEDCEMSDCLYCGMATHRWMLSENLACGICEEAA